MRRIILSLLLVLTSVFIVSCSDSDSGSSSTFTPISKDNPDTWVGTYDVYHLDASYILPDTGIVISNNCQRDADENNNYSHCNNVEVIGGELVVSKDENGKYRVETKIQLSQKAPLDTGDYLEQTYTYVDYGVGVAENYPDQIYDNNGTPITDEKGNPVLETDINIMFTNVTGRTLTKEFATSTYSNYYQLSVRDPESLNLYDPYQRNLGYDRIIFYKKSDTPKTLDPNTPYTPMNGFTEVPDKADEVVQ